MPSLADLRRRKGLSQEALARAAGVDAALVAALEAGQTTAAGQKAMRALADAVDVEPGSVHEFEPALGLRLVGETGSGEGAPTGAAEPGPTGPPPAAPPDARRG